MCLDLGKAREYEKLKELKSVDNYRTEAVRGRGKEEKWEGSGLRRSAEGPC